MFKLGSISYLKYAIKTACWHPARRHLDFHGYQVLDLPYFIEEMSLDHFNELKCNKTRIWLNTKKKLVHFLVSRFFWRKRVLWQRRHLVASKGFNAPHLRHTFS